MSYLVRPAPARMRIISIDGGGIYGLATAIWLRRLCEKEPRFLSYDPDRKGDENDVRLFAGTSAGALNCLLLAKHKSPRDAVLRGDLEKFWEQGGTFSNQNPVTFALSMLGISGWFSAHDFHALLRDTFGTMRLGDLPQQVLISTYNWTGSGNVPASRAGQATQHWKPKFFNNACLDDADADRLVADVAYAAAAPPTLRPIFDGFGDGGSFSGNPVLPSLAHMKRHYRLQREGLDAFALDVLTTTADARARPSEFNAHPILDRLTVLSVGSGQRLPRLGRGDVNLGLMFSYAPTHPAEGDYWPTSSYCIDAATEEAEFITKELLGAPRALRLNPAVLGVPAVTAAMLARNPMMRKALAREIRRHAEGDTSTYAIQGTLGFLQSTQGWDSGRVTEYANWTPQRELTDRLTSHAPALVTIGDGQLAMAWKGHGDQRDIWISMAKDYRTVWTWMTLVSFAGDDPPPGANSGPALALSKRDEVLIMAWRAPHSPTQSVDAATALYVSHVSAKALSPDDVWSKPAPVSYGRGAEGLLSLSAPSLAAQDGILVLTWQEDDGTIGVARGKVSATSIDWTSGDAPRGRPGNAPAVAAGFGRLSVSDPDLRPLFVMVWNEGPTTIKMSTSADGMAWSAPADVETFPEPEPADRLAAGKGNAVPGIEGGPALVYGGDEKGGVWYMAWPGRAEPNIWVAVSPYVSEGPPVSHRERPWFPPAGPWFPPVQLRDRAIRKRPALARIQPPGRDAQGEIEVPRLVMAWHGFALETIRVASLQLPERARAQKMAATMAGVTVVTDGAAPDDVDEP